LEDGLHRGGKHCQFGHCSRAEERLRGRTMEPTFLLRAGAERVGELASVAPPFVAVLYQTPLDGRTEDSWKARHQRRERDVLFGNVSRGESLEGRAVEWESTAQHIVAKHTERVEIAPSVDVELPGCLFGRHVVRRSERARCF